MNAKVGFRGQEAENIVLCEGEEGGFGVFENLIVRGDVSENDPCRKYLHGNILKQPWSFIWNSYRCNEIRKYASSMEHDCPLKKENVQ